MFISCLKAKNILILDNTVSRLYVCHIEMSSKHIITPFLTVMYTFLAYIGGCFS